MSQHELILLSPYRFPGANALTLAPEDMACWLNGHSVLWHPAALWEAKGPPRVDASYDHETPRANCIYAVPDTPPTYLPDDWRDRVRQAGSIAFTATPDRAATLANLREALAAEGAPALGCKECLDLPNDKIGPFFGIGYGHLLQATLAEAMEHENLLETASFWDEVQHSVALVAGLPFTPSAPAAPLGRESAPFDEAGAIAAAADDSDSDTNPNIETPTDPHIVGELSERRYEYSAHETAASMTKEALTREADPNAWIEHLQNAASKLQSAREVLYPVTIHLLDLCLLDETASAESWPVAFQFGIPTNILAASSILEKLAAEQPEKMALLRERVQNDQAEICGGCYIERDDAYLPLDSQLWNLRRGLDVARELLGADIRVFARRRFGFHPQMPLLLTTHGITKTLFLVWDDTAAVPTYTSLVVSWPSPDGKQVDAFVRAPKPADSAETFFNLGHWWFKTTREDHSATVFLIHTGKPAAPWHRDLMELARLGPVFGQWTTFSRYLSEVMAGEYPTPPGADEFHSDYLNERVQRQLGDPVSAFARHVRQRRRLDACWTFAALRRALCGSKDALDVAPQLTELEYAIEASLGAATAGLDAMEKSVTAALAERLQVRGAPNQPGYLLLNPCSFARRAAVELDGAKAPLPIDGPVKACQLDSDKLRAVVEVPALGFAWIPREGPPGTPLMTARLRLADSKSNTIRNEFFEVEVDPATGAMKAIRDHKTRVNRLGQRLVFNPGSRMVASKVQVTSSGPALGEIVSEGQLLGEQDQPLANFRQRLRAWLGRPLLEMRIEIEPIQPPAGYPWHAYFGCRFAWRDERAALLRGINGTGYISNHPRPQSAEYLDIRLGRQSTTIFPGGLPFHQRQEGRMLDVILICEGEKATAFDLGIGLDREAPMLTTLGIVSPIAVVPTTKGPPHIGASGWLFHLDAMNLLLTRLTPGTTEKRGDGEKPEPRDAITARILECGGHSGHAEFRCVRDPQRAVVLDARGNFMLESTRSGDTVFLEVTPNDLVHVQVEFS
jgi:alpha-mannosidase